MKRILLIVLGVALAFVLGQNLPTVHGGKKTDTRVFEMRVYYAEPGKMDALHARFRNHTNKLFEKHGMTLIGYWSPIDAKQAQEKLIYILAYPSEAAAKKSWKDFGSDPEWKKVKAETEKNGKLVTKAESVYMNPTDYSPIK
ncbi:MAG: NIPSNAP family protein [Gemmataceae bacterium]|nr:NIPSNAP family protein [Gemmataceae bacterium]MCI0740565.1 NIPSNAP family protein [Gemmataceae bacterium]